MSLHVRECTSAILLDVLSLLICSYLTFKSSLAPHIRSRCNTPPVVAPQDDILVIKFRIKARGEIKEQYELAAVEGIIFAALNCPTPAIVLSVRVEQAVMSIPVKS